MSFTSRKPYRSLQWDWRHLAHQWQGMAVKRQVAVRRSLSGWLALALVGILAGLGFFQPLEQMAYNQLFRLRGEMAWDDRVVVVAIDNDSLTRLGGYPLPRQHYSELLTVLDQAQPNVVAFDLVFSDAKLGDLQLAESIQQHRMVILAQGWSGNSEPWRPIPTLAENAITIGHVSTNRDADGITRFITPQIQTVPALSVAAIATYGFFGKMVPLPPLDRPLWVNWARTANTIPHYSFAEVIEGQVPSQAFQDKVVFVGVTADGLDGHLTPFDRDTPIGGVYLHATVASNLFQQNALHRLPQGWVVIVLLLAGPSLSWAIASHRTWTQVTICAGLAVGWSLLSLLCLWTTLWIPIVMPLALMLLTVVLLIGRDRTRLELENLVLQQLADQDGLTQIANRRRFDHVLQQEWQRQARSQLPLSLLLCDVDYFKPYNDTYGHQAGDECLRHIAHILHQAAQRSADLAARYGGEEFVVLLPNTDAAGATHLATRIQMQINALAIPHASSHVSQIVTLSIGIVTTIPTANRSADSFLRAADQALYQAKHDGRDRYCIAPDP